MDYNKFLLEFGAGSPVTVKYPKVKLLGMVIKYGSFKAVLASHIVGTRNVIVVHTEPDSMNYLQPTTVDWRQIDK